MSDVGSHDKKTKWFYSDIVKDHFFNPRNFLREDPKLGEFNAVGSVGSPACGDELKVWLYIDPKTKHIKKYKWRTFGCASAIAATSVASEIVTRGGGMTIDEALKLRPKDIMEELGGLPARKLHCSVLCDQALHAAIDDYNKNKQSDDIKNMKIKIVVDPDLCIGAASCVTVAPDTFRLNDENKADVLDHGADPNGPVYERIIEVTEEEKENMILAAQSCPTLAVYVYDEEGNQIYPEA